LVIPANVIWLILTTSWLWLIVLAKKLCFLIPFVLRAKKLNLLSWWFYAHSSLFQHLYRHLIQLMFYYIYPICFNNCLYLAWMVSLWHPQWLKKKKKSANKILYQYHPNQSNIAFELKCKAFFRIGEYGQLNMKH